MKNNFLQNLTPVGFKLFSELFKKEILEGENYTPLDGYRCCLITLNFNHYKKLELIKVASEKTLSQEEVNFMNSFQEALEQSSEILEKGFENFKENFLLKIKEEKDFEELMSKFFVDSSLVEI